VSAANASAFEKLQQAMMRIANEQHLLPAA
jgi:hypothetical protein